MSQYQGQGGSGAAAQQQQQKWRKTYSIAITGAANSGGLIQITANGHKFNTGNNVTIASVGGTTEANGNWVVTRTGGNTFTLNGSTFTNAYTSGGTAVRH